MMTSRPHPHKMKIQLFIFKLVRRPAVFFSLKLLGWIVCICAEFYLLNWSSCFCSYS